MTIHSYTEQVVAIFTTPAQLRELADKMEKFWDEDKEMWGKDLVIDTWYGEGLKVKFVIDQESIKN